MATTLDTPKLAKLDLERVRLLGTGAGSQIYLVRDRRTARRYALKVVSREGPEHDVYVDQALHEAQVARMLNHESLLKIYDIKVRKAFLFRTVGVELLMEYVDGEELDRGPGLPLPRLVAVFRRVAAALAHMHRRGVYHGDLKPGNILLARDGAVKVIDFGTAWIRGEEKDRVQGTPHYMAPEQAHRRIVDEKTDLYNFGATMYRMFTGEYANLGIPGLDNGRLNRAVMKPPSSLEPRVPKALSDLIMDCLQPRPDARPASLSEIRARLDEIAASLGPRADEPLDPDAD